MKERENHPRSKRPRNGIQTRVKALRARGFEQKFIVAVIVNVALFVPLYAADCDWNWVLLLFLWVNTALLAILSPFPTAYFVGFLFAFALLLLSRATLERVFGYQQEGYESSGLPMTETILQVGLVSVAVVYFLIVRITWRAAQSNEAARVGVRLKEGQPSSIRESREDSTLALAIRGGALVAIRMIWPIAVLSLTWTLLKTGGFTSYQESYTAEHIAASVSGPWRIVASYSVDALMTAFYIFLATIPCRQEMKIPFLAACSVQLILLMSGARSDFSLFVLLLICYVFLRNRLTPEEGWMTKERGVAILGGSLGLGVLFTFMESWRGVGSSTSLLSFIYNQGVSIKVIDNVVAFGSYLPRQAYWLEFAHSGILARLLGFPILQGNSIERATTGDSLGHALSLLVLGPDRYLSGIATGSSFLAEGYVQWGLVGVVGVGAVVGLILAFIDSFHTGAPVVNAVRLAIAPTVLWAPRGSTFAFVQSLLSPATLFIVVIVFAFAAVAARRTRREAMCHLRSVGGAS